jgi:vacuolar-type H+-ATPase subunit E/Vma4
MGYRELITHLRKEGEEKIQQLWLEAESKAEDIRKVAFKNAEDVRNEHRKKQTRSAGKQAESVIFDADKTAGKIRLTAQKDLADRMFNLARSVLKELRDAKYEEIFTGLAGEIPGSDWSEIRVHPDDTRLAGRYFPDAAILAESSMTGGLEALGNDGKTRIINTFEKRLEKVWDDMLPLLMKDIKKELAGRETHSAP